MCMYEYVCSLRNTLDNSKDSIKKIQYLQKLVNKMTVEFGKSEYNKEVFDSFEKEVKDGR